MIEESISEENIEDEKAKREENQIKTIKKIGGVPSIKKKEQPDFGLGDILNSIKTVGGRPKFEESDDEDEDSVEERTRFSLNSEKF